MMQVDPRLQGVSLLRAWYALIVLVVATLFAFVDRQILVLVVEPLKRDLTLSDAEIGILQGLGFALFAVFASVLIAWLADRLERSRVLAGCVLLWSLATAACGVAHSFAALFTATVGVAVGEAALVPIAFSFIPDLFSSSGRQQANIIYYGSTVLGVGFGLALSAGMLGLVDSARPMLPHALRALASWRLTFFAVAAPGPPIALAIALIGRTPRSAIARRGEASAHGLLAYFSAHRGTALFIFLAGGFVELGAMAFFSWLPPALIRVFKLSPQVVGSDFGLCYSAGVAVGLVLAAVMPALWRQWGGRAASVRALSVTCALAVIPALLFGLVSRPWEAYLLEALFMALVTMGLTSLPTMLQDMAPPRLRARVIAVATSFYMVIGSVGPVVVGALSDHMGGAPRALLTAVVIVMAAGFALGALLYRTAEARFRTTVAVFDAPRQERPSEGRALIAATTSARPGEEG